MQEILTPHEASRDRLQAGIAERPGALIGETHVHPMAR
jgi:hypothetical protein